jgi:signal transduction histidine kinase
LLALANRRRLCEKFGIKSAVHPMSRLKKTSGSHTLIRRAGRWGRLALLVLAGFPWAVFIADAQPADTNWIFEATNNLGQWIWDTNTFDKQTCRLWKPFDIPHGATVARAILRITVDNGYSLFLDGREIGRGSDWRTVTEYDVTQLLSPGPHSLGVEAFNDRLEAGLIFGLHIELVDQRIMDFVSDDSWFVVPETTRNWTGRKAALSAWHPAIVIGGIHHHPWEIWPYGLTTEPALMPIVVRFWQTGWFQFSILTLFLSAVGACVWLKAQLSLQSRSQKLLQSERIRIARDIHDDLGAQLTQLVLLGEVAQREQPEHSTSRTQFNQICTLARELSHGMDEVVWAVNARRDTLRDFASYVCKYAQAFLDPTTIRCRLDVEPELPDTEFDLPLRRNLFLAVKEALNNAAKHSGAAEVFLRIYRADTKVVVTVEDDGQGFDPEQLAGDRNGMANLTQRMDEINGVCELFSAPGAGCRVVFTVPLSNLPRRRWFNRLRRGPGDDAAATDI